MHKWESENPTELEILIMVKLLRQSGFGIAADMIENLYKQTQKG